MVPAANVNLTVASSYYLLILVVPHYSGNKLATTSGYCFLLAVVFLKHLK